MLSARLVDVGADVVHSRPARVYDQVDAWSRHKVSVEEQVPSAASVRSVDLRRTCLVDTQLHVSGCARSFQKRNSASQSLLAQLATSAHTLKVGEIHATHRRENVAARWPERKACALDMDITGSDDIDEHVARAGRVDGDADGRVAQRALHRPSEETGHKNRPEGYGIGATRDAVEVLIDAADRLAPQALVQIASVRTRKLDVRA